MTWLGRLTGDPYGDLMVFTVTLGVANALLWFRMMTKRHR
jgi:hypothetical protein